MVNKIEELIVNMILDKYKDEILAILLLEEDIPIVFCISQTMELTESVEINETHLIIKMKSLIHLNEMISRPAAEIPLELGPLIHYKVLFDPKKIVYKLKEKAFNLSREKIILAIKDAYNKAFTHYVMANFLFARRKMLAFKYATREFAKYVALMVAILNQTYFKYEYEYFLVKRLPREPPKYHRLMAILLEHELVSIDTMKRALDEVWKGCGEVWKSMRI